MPRFLLTRVALLSFAAALTPAAWAAVATPAVPAVSGNTAAPVAANATASASPAKPVSDPLVFCYFNGNGDGLHLAASDDGLHWRVLKNDQIFLKPAVGTKLMRDPSIVRGPDGLFHLVWTTGWNDNGFGYAESKDLINWSEQKFVPVMAHEPTVRNTWAPEIFYDDATREYLIFWASTIPGKYSAAGAQATASGGAEGYDHRIYFTRTKDFKDFSKAEVFFDPGFSVIDAFIVRDGNRYVMVHKDERQSPVAQKNLKVAFADKAAGPYGKSSEPFSGTDWAEGPTVFKQGDEWFVFFDKYRNQRYGLLATKDWEHWTDLSSQMTLPRGIRHGTAFRVPRETLDALEKVQ